MIIGNPGHYRFRALLLMATVVFTLQANGQSSPESADPALHVLSVSRYLERVGDHAVNVAEDVVYISQGEILRHSGKPKKA